jgi:hypothetical protein
MLRETNDLWVLRSAMLAIEDAVHAVQATEDRKDAEDEWLENRLKMQGDGWAFENTEDLQRLHAEPGPEYVGKKVRRFFKGFGKSDGRIVGFLPARLNDGVSLWHMEHEDGDEVAAASVCTIFVWRVVKYPCRRILRSRRSLKDLASILTTAPRTLTQTQMRGSTMTMCTKKSKKKSRRMSGRHYGLLGACDSAGCLQ